MWFNSSTVMNHRNRLLFTINIPLSESATESNDVLYHFQRQMYLHVLRLICKDQMIVHVVHECFSTNDAGCAWFLNCLVFVYIELEVLLKRIRFYIYVFAQWYQYDFKMLINFRIFLFMTSYACASCFCMSLHNSNVCRWHCVK